MTSGTLPGALFEAARVFAQNGKKVYLAGGAVRDILRGQPAHDYDLATDAAPEETAAFFRRVIPTGIKHGTITVLFKNLSIEVTTFRGEGPYSDGRHPDSIFRAATIEEDLSRRDFTMNAVALELPSKKIVDPFGGKEDIQKRLIRAVGNARERFAEDGLRPLRALRFVSQLGFEIERETFEAIRPALPVTARVSAERLRDETEKTVMGESPDAAFLLMERSGLMELLLPELARCRGIEQHGRHRFDVLDHSLLACLWTARKNRSLAVRLAALFHDLGKAETRRLDESGAVTFYRHELHSARIAGEILRRLRWPGAVTEKVCHLIAEHMFHYTPDWNGAAVRRFIVRAGTEHLRDLYDLRRADAFAAAGEETPPDNLAELQARVEAEREKQSALSLKDLAINGHDLIGLGMEKGKPVGIMLRRLLDAVLEDPALNTREKLSEIARNMARTEFC